MGNPAMRNKYAIETLDSVIADGPIEAPAYSLMLSHIPI